jgi:uncharacterized protein (TIGR02145 family)
VGPGPNSTSIPYYYVYDYNGTSVTNAKATANYIAYGVLYNWPAAMARSESSTAIPSGVQGACPTGWHLPSDTEWEILENYLADNGFNYDGTKGGGGEKIAKAMAAKYGWDISDHTGAAGNDDYPEYQNKSGFTALPGGRRNLDMAFDAIGQNDFWWSTSERSTNSAWFRTIDSTRPSAVRIDTNKEHGLSVRCIKD